MQFERSDDLTAYPRHLEEDLAKAAGAGATIAFVPSLQEMYPKGFGTHIEVSGPTRGLCGLTRPGHFRGVTTVVAKLFNLVRPLRAYFGQKDAQQTAIIRKMVHDLDMGLEIVVCPIVREPDGLAMSSRNVHLSSEERRASVCLVEALQRAKDLVEGGETDRTRLQDAMAEVIRLKAGDLARIDYIEIVDPLTMEPAPRVEGETLAALAVFLGKTRLIDNAILCH
jgi:pantoate--beta-alanine ligase